MFNDLFFDFDKDFFKFRRPDAYRVKTDKDKTTIVQNVVGIEEEDLTVEIEMERNVSYLVVRGETKNEILGNTYNVNSRWSVNADEIKNIEYTTKDGLLYIDIFYKKPAKVKISIEKK